VGHHHGSVQLGTWRPQRSGGTRKAGAPLRFEFRGPWILAFDSQILAYEPVTAGVQLAIDPVRIDIGPGGARCALIRIDTIDEFARAAWDAVGWHDCPRTYRG
jgi:hypothetical protein